MIALRYTRSPPFRTSMFLAAGLVASLPGCVSLPAAKPVGGMVSAPERSLDGVPAPVSTTIPLTMDGNRLYAEVSFRKADGGIRQAMAWVNFGMGGLSLSPSLRRDLGPEGSVAFFLGGIPVIVQPGAILPVDADDFKQLGPFPVEAILPAALWPHYRVTLDYATRTLTLAQPSTAPVPGVAVPIEVNEGTGFATVLATVAGQSHPVVLDPGGGYTWWRGSVVRDWLTEHPNWYRADGAVGQSNQAMVDEAFEQQGTVVRVPSVRLGSLELHDVGILGSARGSLVDQVKYTLFWRLWGAGAPRPVDGWLGGNALKPYRITIDYQHRVSYWQLAGVPDTGDLTSVGVSLVHGPQGYTIGGLVSRHGQAVLRDIQVGDTLLGVDGRDVRPMTRGAVITALGGQAGEHRRLTLERQGSIIEADTVVEAEAAISFPEEKPVRVP